MSTLANCIKRAGKALNSSDKEFLNDSRRQYLDEGLSSKEATHKAVVDLLEISHEKVTGYENEIAEKGGNVGKVLDLQKAIAEIAPKDTPKDAAKEPWQVTRQEYEQPSTLKPRKAFNVKVGSRKVDVIRNPTDLDVKAMTKEAIEAHGRPAQGDPVLRFTYDEDGNIYRWAAIDAIHSHIEPILSKIEGAELNQNANNKPDHKGLIKRALFEGKPVSENVLSEYPGIAKEAASIKGAKVDPALLDQPVSATLNEPTQYELNLGEIDEQTQRDLTSTKSEAHSGAKNYAERAVDGLRRINGSVLANSLSKGYKGEKGVALIGQKVNSVTDLAVLAQIYRNPSFETFRIFFTKGDEIVHQTGLTSRNPGSTKIFPDGLTTKQALSAINKTMADSGADGYYLQHNHPSGTMEASGADIRATRLIAENVDGFKGHIIVNEHKFVNIDANLNGTTHELKGIELEYQLNDPSIPDFILGSKITSPTDVAMIGSSFYKPDHITVVGRGAGDAGVNGIMEIKESALLSLDENTLKVLVNRFKRATGSADVFLVADQKNVTKKLLSAPKLYPLLHRAVRSGYVRDVVDYGGSISLSRDLVHSGLISGSPHGKTISVTEKTAGVVKEDEPAYKFKPTLPDFTEKNRRLKEEHKTIWNKAKKSFIRGFSPGGLLPENVFKEKIKRDSNFEVVEFDIRHLVGQLERAVKSKTKKSFSKLDDTDLKRISDVLTGESSKVSDNAIDVAVVAMRQYVDGLSTEYANILNQQSNDLLEKGIASGDKKAIAESIERAELMKVIIVNSGKYLHRSYQAFDDPKWFKKIPDDIIDDARAYLTAGYLEKGASDKDAAKFAEVVIHEIVKNGTAYDSMESFISESKLGAKDLSLLKKRKAIAPEIRALLGEYKDPRLNFAKTATKMGRLIWNQRFLDQVRKIGMGSFLFEGKNRPPEATAVIAADGSEAYAPLNGLWTFPETNQAFIDALGKESMANWYRTIVQVNGMFKFGKTVLSPTTAARNWQSALFFTLANGHIDLRHMQKSISGLREYFTHNGKKSELAYLRKMKQLGVVYDTAYAGEMMRLLDDSKIENFLGGSGPGLIIKDALYLAQKFYQYGDDFWKIIGFENEKQLLIKHAGMSEKQAEIEAAERIRNTYPTYSMVGRTMQFLRKFPLAGSFVSFPSEIIRTSINMVKYVAKDMKDPKMRPLAIRRAAGLMFVSGFAAAAQTLSKVATGLDDDDEEAVRMMAAPWQKNSNLVFTGRDKDGNITYFDLSFVDPYNWWKRPITAILRDQPWEDKAADVINESLSPFLGRDIAAGAIFEIATNKRGGSGAPVYKEHDLPASQAGDIANHFRKAVQPGIASNLERTWKALKGEVSTSGRKYTLRDEGMAWVGWRLTTLDPKVALYYRSFEFKDAKADASKIMSQALKTPSKISNDELKDTYERSLKVRGQAYDKMFKVVEAVKQGGLRKRDVRRILKSAGVSRSDVNDLWRGRIPRWKPSNQSEQIAIKKAKALYSREEINEIRRRYKLARRF